MRLFGSLACTGGEGAIYRELVSVWRSHELEDLMPGIDADDGFCPGFVSAGRQPYSARWVGSDSSW